MLNTAENFTAAFLPYKSKTLPSKVFQLLTGCGILLPCPNNFSICLLYIQALIYYSDFND